MFSPISAKLFTAGLLAYTAFCSPNLIPRQALPSCNRDNCYRAVAGTRVGVPTSNSADCSSFFSITATACATASTVIVTTTSTSTSSTYPTALDNTNQKRTLADDLGRRQNGVCTPTTIRPSSVPTYASACSGAARYSSACSCLIGAKATTVTTTVVLTGGTTTTSTAVAVATVRGSVTGIFRVSNGQYLFADQSNVLQTDPALATVFTIDNVGHLTYISPPGQSVHTVYVDRGLAGGFPDSIANLYGSADPPATGAPITCVLSGGTSGQLLCSVTVDGRTSNTFSVMFNDNEVFFSTPGDANNPVTISRSA